MATARCENGRFFFDYPEGNSREVKLMVNTANGSNLIEVIVADENSVNRATTMRLKGQDGGQRVAADFPGCDATYIIVDANGKITNG